MEEQKSKVYIQTDDTGRITRCEGGYAPPDTLTGWTYLDQGTGDKYNLCQSHYFTGGLYTMDGICRYKYADGACALRTDAEMQADRDARPEPEPTAEDITLDMLADHEERICMMEINSITE